VADPISSSSAACRTGAGSTNKRRPGVIAVDVLPVGPTLWPIILHSPSPTRVRPRAQAIYLWSASERRQAQRAVGRWPVGPRRALPIELPVTVSAMGITRGADHHAGAPPHPTRPSFNSFYARAPVRVPILLWSASECGGDKVHASRARSLSDCESLITNRVLRHAKPLQSLIICRAPSPWWRAWVTQG
jgi:hypothetical protein